MRRALVALASLPIALLVAGCSAEDPAQRYVREQVAEHVAGLDGYDPARTHCTSTPRPWLVERPTEVYICTAQRDDGGCDWFRARLRGNDVTVTMDTPNAGCVLPV